MSVLSAVSFKKKITTSKKSVLESFWPMLVFTGPISPMISTQCTFIFYFSEELLEDENFKDRQLVAILLAKLYFYLNDYDESLSYALRAGKYFDI